jgi:hypothetical protein
MPITIIPPERWLAVDWTWTDRKIAEQLGVSRARVNQVRCQLGKPSAPKPLRTPAWLQAMQERVAARGPLLQGLPFGLIKRLIDYPSGMRRAPLYVVMQRLGVTPLRYKDTSVFLLADFGLPNSLLCEAWGSPSIHTAANMRSWRALGQAIWTPRSEVRPSCALAVELQVRLAAEQRLARAYHQAVARRNWVAVARMIQAHRDNRLQAHLRGEKPGATLVHQQAGGNRAAQRKGVDWSWPDAALAKALGAPVASVRAARRRWGHGPVRSC